MEEENGKVRIYNEETERVYGIDHWWEIKTVNIYELVNYYRAYRFYNHITEYVEQLSVG